MTCYISSLRIRYLICFCSTQFFFPSVQYLRTSDNHTVFNNVLEMFCFAGVLRILTEMFLPHISLGDLEQTFFSKVLPKVCHLQLNVTFSVSTVLKTFSECIGSSFEGSPESQYFACKLEINI